jgi:hypothetical protein
MNTNKYPEKDIPNDCHCVHCIEDTKAKSPHNKCAECNETIKPDQWSENNFTLCIDCG